MFSVDNRIMIGFRASWERDCKYTFHPFSFDPHQVSKKRKLFRQYQFLTLICISTPSTTSSSTISHTRTHTHATWKTLPFPSCHYHSIRSIVLNPPSLHCLYSIRKTFSIHSFSSRSMHFPRVQRKIHRKNFATIFLILSCCGIAVVLSIGFGI